MRKKDGVAIALAAIVVTMASGVFFSNVKAQESTKGEMVLNYIRSQKEQEVNAQEMEEKSSDIDEKVQKKAEKNQSSNFREVKLSYEQLCAKKSKITNKVQNYYNMIKGKSEKISDEEKQCIYTVNGVGVKEGINKVRVHVTDVGEKNINLLKKYLVNDVNVEFIESEKPQLTTSWFPGNRIFVRRSSSKDTVELGSYSTGPRAKLGSNIGFVTAGHNTISPDGKLKVGDVVYTKVGGKEHILGTITKTSFISGKKVDASFVDLNTWDYSVVSRTPDGKPLSTSYGKIEIDQKIYKYGYATGKTSGVISDDSFDHTYSESNVTIFDTMYTTLRVATGDSGGVCYDEKGNLYGIVSYNVGDSFAGVIKAKNIKSTFGSTFSWY